MHYNDAESFIQNFDTIMFSPFFQMTLSYRSMPIHLLLYWGPELG